ncbi:G-protein coupled receptor 4-like [Neolamprologus brichardi]|uniref:G-protein coupled receptor 4-like n=1 Tax=Neolamprologus brichardi TaxID=32507 RepID=UPI0003EC0C58|nr:G-protein coupled receptor 4-like [Neolamprologus brichardi]
MDSMIINNTNSCTAYSSVQWDMYPTVYSLFFSVGFPANCLSLYVAWMLMKKGNSMAVYLVSLSISDLLYTVTLPIWIVQAMKQHIGDELCNLMAVIMYNSFFVGSGLLCCICADRYLAVVYPLHFNWIREVRTAVLVSIAVWALEIAIHIVLLHHMGALQASRYLCDQQIPMTQEDAAVALTRFALSFLVPTFIMTFCYHNIMRSIKRNTSIQVEERRKVEWLLLLLLLTYIVSFMPYQLVMLLRAILEPGTCVWATRLKSAFMVTVATTTLNSTLDPIIYCLINESAKTEIKKTAQNVRRLFMRGKHSDSSV